MVVDERVSYNTILFDLDGTLTDPKTGIINSVKHALSKLGIEENNMQGLEMFIGPPLQESFRTYYGLDGERLDNAIKYYREHFSTQGMYQNHLYPGIPDLLAGLKDMGKKMGIATSKPTGFAEKIAEYFEIATYFSFIIGSNLDGTRASKAEVIRYILANCLKEEDGRAVMVGDHAKDITGARENNMDSICVTWGYGKTDEIAEAKPTHIFDSVENLMRFFGITP